MEKSDEKHSAYREKARAVLAEFGMLRGEIEMVDAPVQITQHGAWVTVRVMIYNCEAGT